MLHSKSGPLLHPGVPPHAAICWGSGCHRAIKTAAMPRAQSTLVAQASQAALGDSRALRPH